MKSARTFTGAIMILALLSGCTHYEPLSLHGAGSMRVEMEVYKGPATLSIDAQIGQTAAVVADLVRALDVWYMEARAFQPGELDQFSTLRADRTCSPSGPESATGRGDCIALSAAMASAERAVGFACYMIHTPSFSGSDGLRLVTNLPFATCARPPFEERWEYLFKADPTVDHLRRKRSVQGSHAESTSDQTDEIAYESIRKRWEQATRTCDSDTTKVNFIKPYEPIANRYHCYHEPIIIALDHLSAQLQITASRTASAMVRYVPRDQGIRGLIAEYAFIASEYGGQISARVNVLQKQLVDGKNANSLPSSDFIRGAKSTDFISLINWLAASDKHLGIRLPGAPDVAARVRMADRLNSGRYWEKYNEVYASGQGDVAMAFVRNEIGNWDLKSFSNDPSKLLSAYRRTTDALLASAAKLARGAASGGAVSATAKLSAAGKAAALANQLAGADVPGSSPLDTAAMHARVIARIRARQASYKARLTALTTEQTALGASVDRLDQRIRAAEVAGPDEVSLSTQLADEKARLTAVKAQIGNLPTEAIAGLRDILEDHSAVLTAAQEAIVAPAKTAVQTQ